MLPAFIRIRNSLTDRLLALLSMHLHFLFPLAPKVTPANVSGGGGSRSELVITWEVK